jgi:hypothetical protein
MALSSLLSGLSGPWMDDLLVWAVAAAAALIAVVALVNAIDMVLDSDAEAG